MYRMDYHLHTDQSMDSEMPLQALCEAAIAQGLQEICLTDHIEFGHPANIGQEGPHMPDYWAAFDGARARFPQLVIRAGIEIGDNPACRDRIHAFLDAEPLDYRLLSLHLIDATDPYLPGFCEHWGTRERAYRRYIECKLESLLAWDAAQYDAMAHLGYVTKFSPFNGHVVPLTRAFAPDAMDALLEKLAKDEKAIEINTSGRRNSPEFHPTAALLTRFAQLGGRFVTLGSDAHTPDRVGRDLDEARVLAKACGLRYCCTFAGRRLVAHVL